MKYNKKEIMRNAWAIRRETGVSMSVALKAAWATAKAIKAAEKETSEIYWNTKVIVNDWAKHGKNRTYVSYRVYTNAWNVKREVKIGYTDNLTGEFFAA